MEDSVLEVLGDIDEFCENGKKGLKKSDGTVLFPAIYDEIFQWSEDSDVFYTRIGDEFHYYNLKHEEILTTYRKFDGVDDKCMPYYIGEEQDRKTLVTMQMVADLSDPQSCFCLGNNVRLDRILKSEVADIVKNNCEIWDNGIDQLDHFYSEFTYIYSAYYAQSKSDTPIEDCLGQFTCMGCYDSSWNYIIKIWTNRNTQISIREINKLVSQYQNLEDSAIGLPLDCVTIGYDDSLEDGMVRMFQVIYFTDRWPCKLDDIHSEMLASRTLSEYKEKKQLLLDTLEEYRKENNWTDKVYKSFYNDFFGLQEISGRYKGLVWEDEIDFINYLVDEESFSEKEAVYDVCREIAYDARHDGFSDADIQNAYKKIEWAISNESCLMIVYNGNSCLDHIQAAISAVEESAGDDSSQKINALNKIEQLLVKKGALTAAEIRSWNINPLNLRHRKNDKDKPIAVHIDKCRIYYEVWLMRDCGTPIRVGDRITELCAERRTGEVDYICPEGLFEDFMYKLCGKVESIVVKYRKTTDRVVEQKPYKEIEVSFIDGWTEGADGFDYYVITLSDVSVVEQGYCYRPDRID